MVLPLLFIVLLLEAVPQTLEPHRLGNRLDKELHRDRLGASTQTLSVALLR